MTIAGCVAPPSPFDGERHARDELPAALSEFVADADPATSRYQGDAAGRSFYLVRGTGDVQLCVGYTDGTAEKSGFSCGGGDWLRITLDDGSEFETNLHGFSETPRSGVEDLSPWLRQVAPARGE